MSVNKKIGLMIVFLVLFLITGGLVISGAADVFDKEIQRLVFLMHTEWLTLLFRGITYSANWQTMVLLCSLLLLIKKTRFLIGVPISLAAEFSAFTNHQIKILFGRARPETTLHLIEQGGLSFPSGHAMTGLVFYGVLLYFILKNKPEKRAETALFFGFACWVFLIGFSRIYLGVHYPTDVLAGWFMGAAILTLAILIIEKVYPLKQSEIEMTVK